MKKTIITLLAIASVSSAFAGSYARSSVRSSFRSSPSRSYSSPTRSYTPTRSYSAPKTTNVTQVNRVTRVDNSSSGSGLFSFNNLMLGWLIWGNHNTQNKLNNLENRIATSTATSTK